MTQKKHADRPQVLKIGPHYYTVDWLTTDEWAASSLPDDADGATLTGQARMAVLLKPMPTAESHYQMVLLHEVHHAAWNASGMMLQPKWNEGDEEDVEERIIAGSAPIMLQVFQDNPDLVAYLTSPGGRRR